MLSSGSYVGIGWVPLGCVVLSFGSSVLFCWVEFSYVLAVRLSSAMVSSVALRLVLAVLFCWVPFCHVGLSFGSYVILGPVTFGLVKFWQFC